LLSRELFGSQMDVFRIEVGYKPYWGDVIGLI
jgi:hypothetical protein